MRPVTRGDPTTYKIIAGSAEVESAEALQKALLRTLEINTSIDTIMAALGTADLKLDDLVKQRKLKPLNEIIGGNAALWIAYTSAQSTSPLDKVALQNAAHALITNLREELSWYVSNKQTLEERVNNYYPRARGDLIHNIGQFCSYCEMPLATNLAVEHKLPKAEFPFASLAWSNFLLACAVCNGRKSRNPSRAKGAAAAQANGCPIPPAEQHIQAGALSTYLWPDDDAGYPNWQDFFQYRMKKVLYDAGGTLIKSVDIPDHVVAGWNSGNTQVTLLSESGYAANVQFAEPLQEVRDGYSAILGDLNANTIGNNLQQVLSNLDVAYCLNFTDVVPQLAPIGPQRWKVTETREYTVDTTNQSIPTLVETTGGRRSDLGKFCPPTMSFFKDLGRGVIPKQIQDILGDTAQSFRVDPTTQSVTITHPERTTYVITVVKTILVVDAGVKLQVFSVQEVPVELHLVPVASPRAAQAGRVIEDLQLNNIDLQDRRFSDRRMVKRTRTWFVALDSVRSLDEAVASTGSTDPPKALVELMAETAVATGYWSVWRSVFQTFLSSAIRDKVGTFLRDQSKFPGTR